MRSVFVKSSLFSMIIFLMSCSNKETRMSLQEESKKGFYVTFPFVEKKTILIENKKMKLEMNKILNENSIQYNLGFESQRLYPVPLNRDVTDYEPFFDIKLDKLVEQEFSKTPDSSFVIKYNYGTGNITWNYLYKVQQNKIYLDKIFFIEPNNSNNDTIAYISKLNINKLISTLNIKAIKDSMTKMENRKSNNYKFVIR